MSEGSDALRAVERGLAVLRELGDPAGSLSVGELAAKVGFSRAAVRRVVLTLREHGYVVEETPGRYALHANVLRLGWRSLALRPLGDLARPVLRELCEETGHLVVLSRRLGIEIIVESVVAPPAGNVFHVTAGDRLPPMTSDAGRLLYEPAELDEPQVASLLTGMPELRARLADAVRAADTDGYCLVDQEMEPGLVSVGVPIAGREGRVAALSLFAYAGATDAAALLELLPALREGSRRLASDLSRGASAFAV